MTLSSTFNIAIIGFGPKGLYAFERLLAHLKSKNIHIPIAIYIFNQNGYFGAGNVYRCDQPPYLIMNYANRNIDAWSRKLPEAIVEDSPSFAEWLAAKMGTSIKTIQDKFAPRSLVGQYLLETFAELKRKAPANVEIIPYVATVQRISKCNERFVLHTKENKEVGQVVFDTLMLTTGHLGNGAHFDSENTSDTNIDFIYPTSSKLSFIEANSKVAIKGFGLTCIDAILALTEGRGGTFELKAGKNLSYLASGFEPQKIYPFSRTGPPMIPRGDAPEDNSSLHYFSKENIAALQTKPYCSFQKDILPLIKKEFKFSYYTVLFKKYGWDLEFHSDDTKVKSQIDHFHKSYPSEEKFCWDFIVNPFQGHEQLSHNEVEGYMKFLIREADAGTSQSGYMTAAATWRKISPVFNELYSFSGLDADSHQRFDNFYFGVFNRIAYGPPVDNMKKMIALAEAGLVDFSFVRSPRVATSTDTNGAGYSLEQGQNKTTANYLINARVPKNDRNLLYSNLLEDGLAREYVNQNEGNYTPRNMDIDAKGHLIDSLGNLQKRIRLYGTPTEGATFDNDTLSRHRNNLASEWAQDIAALLKQKQNF